MRRGGIKCPTIYPPGTFSPFPHRVAAAGAGFVWFVSTVAVVSTVMPRARVCSGMQTLQWKESRLHRRRSRTANRNNDTLKSIGIIKYDTNIPRLREGVDDKGGS